MKRILIILSLLILAAVLIGVHALWKARAATHIAVTGGRAMSIRLPAPGPHFLQSDARWAAEKIGGSAETLRRVGCAMCSVASAARFLGEDTDPLTLNRALIAQGGYTSQGWLVWSVIGNIFENRIEVTVHNRPSHAELDRALERGEYAIVKFILPMGIPHWVVVVGKEGQDYLVHDPLLSAPEPIPLSRRASGIYSVRVVRRGGV